jgi:hypothetical protein
MLLLIVLSAVHASRWFMVPHNWKKGSHMAHLAASSAAGNFEALEPPQLATQQLQRSACQSALQKEVR